MSSSLTDEQRRIASAVRTFVEKAVRYYCDGPLLIIGEGTNEIQRLVIARQLLRRHALEEG